MQIFFAILAFILFWGMIGDKIQENRNNYTMAFAVCVIAMVILQLFG